MHIRRIAANAAGKTAYQSAKQWQSATDIYNAIAGAPTTTDAANLPTTAKITSSLCNGLRSTPGWDQTEFKAFHPLNPSAGSGRQIAIDARHQGNAVCVEIELSNQTTFSHDLLKLQTAHTNNHCQLGVVIVLTERARMNLSNHCVSYLTFEKAHHWLRIYSHLSVPIVVIGVE